MHENRRYVKLARIGSAMTAALVFPAGAGAELVSKKPGPAALAVGRNGTPYVAHVDGCALHVAHRTATGWRDRLAVRCLPFAAGRIELAGSVVDPRSRVSVLVRDANGSRIVLVRQGPAGFRVQPVVRAAARSVLGIPGLALDAAGVPAVAYAVARPSRDTFLRLVRPDRSGRLKTTAITQKGFPPASLPPSATPVLVRGRLHVVETYSTEGIEWFRDGKRWLGQFLFASTRGQGVGPVFSAAAGDSTWTAATLLQPTFGETDVLLTERADTETTSIVFSHALVAGLALADGRPEVAANESVEIGDGVSTAGLVADADGATAELDGAVAGYAVDNRGSRQLLLSTGRGREWFTSPTRPATRVELTAGADGALSGRVAGVVSGTVDIFREQARGARTLVATVPLAADGSFAFRDAPPGSPTLYRAVYRDPASGIPFASLLRTPVG
jgi:hypothetical protein